MNLIKKALMKLFDKLSNLFSEIAYWLDEDYENE